MYLTTLEELPDVIAERTANRRDIRQAVDACIAEEYGIVDFCQRTLNFFNLSDKQCYLSLCRQIPSVRLEDIACYVGAKILGHKLLSLSFVDDSFSDRNHEKRSYVELPWSNVGRKNISFFKKETICDGTMANYNGTPLRKIKIRSDLDALSVPDFHFKLRRRVFGHDNNLQDVSGLHREYARAATRLPKQVHFFVNGLSCKRTPTANIIQSENFRPTGDWYYRLYFSWFLDGTMVLLETYDNDLAEVSLAKILFEQTMRWLKDRVGWQPLVLKVPPLNQEMLFLPERIIESPKQALNDLEQNFQTRASGNSVEFFGSIARTASIWRQGN